MEYVKVIYPRRRAVYIDGERNGYTMKTLRVDAGTHVFELGGPSNYAPPFRRAKIKGTTVFEPLEIVFRPKEDE